MHFREKIPKETKKMFLSGFRTHNHINRFLRTTVLLIAVILNAVGVGVSCRNLYSFVVYLYVYSSESITSVGKERANLSAVVYL